MPQQAGPRPGWYPDATSSTPLFRYWDGARWTSQTRLRDAGGFRPPAAPVGTSAPKAPPKRGRGWQAVKWGAVAAFVLAASVIGIVLARGQEVCSVSTQGVVVFATKGEQCVPKGELEKAQQGLTNDVAEPKADAAAAPVPPSLPDLNGQWGAAGGITYLITQGGSDATIEEYTPGLGLSATGVGTVRENGAEFWLTAYNGTTPTAQLDLQGANVLAGTVFNPAMNVARPIVMTRSG